MAENDEEVQRWERRVAELENECSHLRDQIIEEKKEVINYIQRQLPSLLEKAIRENVGQNADRIEELGDEELRQLKQGLKKSIVEAAPRVLETLINTPAWLRSETGLAGEPPVADTEVGRIILSSLDPINEKLRSFRLKPIRIHDPAQLSGDLAQMLLETLIEDRHHYIESQHQLQEARGALRSAKTKARWDRIPAGG